MATLAEKLLDFAGAIGSAINAPDGYPDFRVEMHGSMEAVYQYNKTTALEDWAEIRPRLKRDLDKAAFIDAKLKEGFDAFDRGDKVIGRKAMFDIYNLQLRKLR